MWTAAWYLAAPSAPTPVASPYQALTAQIVNPTLIGRILEDAPAAIPGSATTATVSGSLTATTSNQLKAKI